MRCACSDTALHDRTARQIPGDALRGASLLIDGYNVLTTMEAALGGGVILHARDGCYRDMASMHGSYRKVAETIPALEHLADALLALGASHATWLLDAPVSNSGRLRQVMQELAAARGWDFTIEIVPDPDAVLTRSEEIVATADAAILDRCGRWFNLARYAVDRAGLTKSVVDLRDVSE